MIDTQKHKVYVAPGGDRIDVATGENLLEVLSESGVFLRSDCGGKGVCGKCLVTILESSPADDLPFNVTKEIPENEKSFVPGNQLACRLTVHHDLSIQIPETSLISPEVIQKPPLSIQLPADLHAPRKILGAANDYGLAVDLGTTTIAIYLCNISSNTVIASVSVKNPQSFFGDDVISRINAVRQNRLTLKRLQKLAAKAIEFGVASLLKKSQVKAGRIKKMVVVGNPTMIHLFVGEDPDSIGVFPYRPVFTDAKTFKARDLSLWLNPSMEVSTLPLISGFLGSDIVGAGLANETRLSDTGTMLIDIGTNGEVMLRGKNGFIATSCATGPAFEGATLRHGMHAVSGAVDAVKIDGKTGGVSYSLIQNDLKKPKRAAGICGSGVVSAIAELLRAGILLESGQFNPEIRSPNLRKGDDGILEFLLVPSSDAVMGEPITLTQRDVRSVQLGKGAISAGVELLCRDVGLNHPKKLLVAGGFGNFLNKEDAITIGMFPKLSDENFHVVGNAAGLGAVISLFDPGSRKKVEELIASTHIKDLAADPLFQKTFLSSLSFSQ